MKWKTEKSPAIKIGKEKLAFYAIIQKKKDGI